jgi:hypothetical protein
MNLNAVTRNYGKLTPDERFRLILAAGGRGDEAERNRLVRAGGRLTVSLQDHAPFAQAFNELSSATYMDLLDTAARYIEAFDFVDETDEAETPCGRLDDENAGDSDETAERPEEEPAGGESEVLTPSDLAGGLILAAGFMLKTKVDGWKLFCERLNVPPFLMWSIYRGFPRLQRALDVLAGTDEIPVPAFVAEGMVRFFSRLRPPGASEAMAERLISAEKVADELEAAYRERAKWWGG